MALCASNSTATISGFSFSIELLISLILSLEMCEVPIIWGFIYYLITEKYLKLPRFYDYKYSEVVPHAKNEKSV